MCIRDSVNTAAQTIQQDYDSIEVYLKDDVTEEQADTIIDDLRTQDGVEDAYYKSKEDAMDEFKTRWGENGYLLNSLQENQMCIRDSIKVSAAVYSSWQARRAWPVRRCWHAEAR